MSRSLLIAAVLLATYGCSRSVRVTGAGDLPTPTTPREVGPSMSTITTLSRDTVVARALAAMRERGYTEVSPDAARGQVRGKSLDGVSIVVEAVSLEGRTTVTVRGFRDQTGAGLDTAAMAQVLTLMSTIAPPPAATDTTRRPPPR